MSLSAQPKPFNSVRCRTSLNIGTRFDRTTVPVVLYLLFAVAVMATLSIWVDDPRAEWTLEICIFSLTVWAVLQGSKAAAFPLRPAFGWALAAIAGWGVGQLAFGATVYRYVTAVATLRMAALAATALLSCLILSQDRIHRWLLPSLATLGFLVSVVSVAAYYTSPGQVLWSFPSPYPDVWGPFLSRNHFAQFLELCLPVALWLWLFPASRLDDNRRPKAGTLGLPVEANAYGVMSCGILAAGFLSASRAGALLLGLETAVILTLWAIQGKHRSRASRYRKAWKALGLATGMGALALFSGTVALWGRFAEPEPFQFRSQIFQSVVDMIGERPWQGYGLGTFEAVYPEFAHFDAGRIVNHAHNDWLEWTAEGGFGFVAAWLVLLAVIGAPAARSIWGIGVIAVFLHALVDYPFNRLGVAIWVFILSGATERTQAHLVLPQRRIE